MVQELGDWAALINHTVLQFASSLETISKLAHIPSLLYRAVVVADKYSGVFDYASNQIDLFSHRSIMILLMHV